MAKRLNLTRRDFLRIIGATAMAGAAWRLGLQANGQKLVEVSTSRILMGTVVKVTIIGEDSAAAEAAAAASLGRMTELEALLSRYRPDSELSRLNTNGYLPAASPPLLHLIEQSRQLSEKSDGAFDISVYPLLDLYQAHQQQGKLPSAEAVASILPLINYKNIHVDGQTIRLGKSGMILTLDGIGKGYIVDEGTAELRRRGFVNMMVEAGGDLMAAGAKDHELSWRVGIRPPRPAMEPLQTGLRLANQAAATSGDYFQAYTADLHHHHILDPRTGYSNPELASVTVTAPSAMLADGLATAVMVLGSQWGTALLSQHPECAGLMITKNLDLISTKNL